MDLRTWQTLAEPKHEELIRLAAETVPTDVAAVSRLRNACQDVELVRAALMLTEARRKAVAKFGAERAATLWADPQGVEMATSFVVAEHKQRRINRVRVWNDVYDLCCGIGGDAMALSRRGCVTAVDIDPVRAWMAGRNIGRPAMCADVTTMELADDPTHIDPARRIDGDGRRLWRAEDLRPSLASVRTIMDKTCVGGAVKLGPGADLAAIERELPGCSVEIISERGTLVQAVAWCGEQMLARPGEREATLIMRTPDQPWSQDSSFGLSGRPGNEPPSASAEAARHVFEPDDSIERADLLGVLCESVGVPMLHERVGLLTSDAPIESPWLTTFEVLDSMPWHERRVKQALDALGAGIVEVKTRGKAVNPDVVQKTLRGKGEALLTVFVLRFDATVRAIITRRLPAPELRS